ncbi:MAG: hypothetical protein EBU90_16765 [Proteobacteria bacterium]|nr:hypothetical protein [Pseudomonadota bacterium]
MILISHRGNLNGPDPSKENDPHYIDYAIECGFEVEVDLRITTEGVFLGHDSSAYEISMGWLFERSKNLWIHCKTLQTLSFLRIFNSMQLNYFWHEDDAATITSLGYVITKPDVQPLKGFILMIPERHNTDTSLCTGICSDYIQKYKNNSK